MKVSEPSVKQMIEENSHNKYTTLQPLRRTASCSKSRPRVNLIRIRPPFDLNSMALALKAPELAAYWPDPDLSPCLKQLYRGFLEDVLGDRLLLDEDFTAERRVFDSPDRHGCSPLAELEARGPSLQPHRGPAPPRATGMLPLP